MELMGALRGGQPRADPPARGARRSARRVLLDVENHHNFAWRERHVLPDGRSAT